MSIRSLLLLLVVLIPVVSFAFLTRNNSVNKQFTRMADTLKPLAIVVNVEIVEERIEEFLKVIEIDAKGSIENENGGCLRFDVLRDHSDPKKFTFYEVYVDAEAAARHREYAHFKVWSDFKASGGVVSQTAVKSNAIFYTA
jgi:quinol monooxygenase YgiN